jgi:hypothetical protein
MLVGKLPWLAERGQQNFRPFMNFRRGEYLYHAAAAAQLLPHLADAEQTEAALQRHPLVRTRGK